MFTMYYRICIQHGKHLRTCKNCSPQQALVSSLRKSVRSALKRGGSAKKASSLSYLGAQSWDEVQFIILQKIKSYNQTHRIKIKGMEFDLDHIKPVKAFGGKNMRACCHITNLQPIPRELNLQKRHKWNASAEAYWKQNIIFNYNYFEIFIP